MSGYQSDDEDPRGVLNPDFLAIGLGGTNMMSMLWTVAMGRRAVGVEMRGDPFLGVHWNIRVDLYHQFGLIDKMMLERYGEEGIPRRGNNRPFRLAETLYSIETTAGDIVADEVIDGFDADRHIAGTIHHVEFIDDRWRDGVPNRVVTLLQPPKPPSEPDAAKIRTNMIDVLDGPSTFQGGASTILVLLRRYLERIEEMDLESGREPRVRLFTKASVIKAKGGEPDGIYDLGDGRKGFRIEVLQEFDFKGKFVRVRRPGSQPIDTGSAELVMIAEGFHSSDAERMGFQQEDVVVDHQDGRGPVVAQADFLAGLIEVLVGGRLRRRISSEFDENGNEFWVRQIAVGHEDDPEVGWVLVQVPDFKSFDPIAAGLAPEGTDPKSAEFFAAYEHLVYDYYAQHAGDVLELPKETVKKIQMVYGPKLFSLIERAGKDAQIAANVVVAGDSFGNGHFLTSGGAMTGMIGHSWRVLEYWQERDAGKPQAEAIRKLADMIKEDTHGWLHVSAKEYSEAVPINFGAERIKQIEAQSGISSAARAKSIDATRRLRHSLLPLNPSDWRRLFLRNGKVFSSALPELHAMHPALRGQRAAKRGAKVSAVFATTTLGPATVKLINALLGQPGVRLGLVSEDPIDGLPESVRVRLAAHALVDDAKNPQQIGDAVRGMKEPLGSAELLISTFEELQVPVAEARAALGIPGTNAMVAKTVRDKMRMRQVLADAGLPVVRDSLIESADAAVGFARAVGYPVVVRPREASRVRAHYRVNSEEQLRGLLAGLRPSKEHPLICEEYVPGQQGSFEVMTVGGIPAWFSASRCHPRPLDVQDNNSSHWSITLPREIDDPADARVRLMGYAALRALGIQSGMSTMEWYRRADGKAVIADVHTRPPGTQLMALMGLAHGADMYRAWGNAAVNGLIVPIPRLYAAGAAFLRGTGVGSRVAAVRGLDKLRKELGDIVVEAYVPRIGKPKSDSYEGDGYVLLRHEDTAMVEQAIERVHATARVELGEPAVAAPDYQPTQGSDAARSTESV